MKAGTELTTEDTEDTEKRIQPALSKYLMTNSVSSVSSVVLLIRTTEDTEDTKSRFR
jgi:hypothetical protein